MFDSECYDTGQCLIMIHGIAANQIENILNYFTTFLVLLRIF